MFFNLCHIVKKKKSPPKKEGQAEQSEELRIYMLIINSFIEYFISKNNNLCGNFIS
jgi:hypothetical protein